MQRRLFIRHEVAGKSISIFRLFMAWDVIVPLGDVYMSQIKENSDVVAIEDGVLSLGEGGEGILKASLSLSLRFSGEKPPSRPLTLNHGNHDACNFYEALAGSSSR